jgi:hypothetical protein
MSEQANPNQRLQEIESLIAQLINSQKHLLQAQVILTDQQDRSGQLFARLVEFAEGTEQRLQRLTEQTDRGFTKVAEKLEQLTDAQKHSDARLDALIAVVDDPVRRNGKPGTSALQ